MNKLLAAIASVSLLFGCANKQPSPPSPGVRSSLHAESSSSRLEASGFDERAGRLPDGRQYHAFRVSMEGNRVATIVVGGLGQAGIKAPCPDLADAPDNKIEYPFDIETGKEVNGVLRLKQGFAWVHVHQSSPSSPIADHGRGTPKRILWITPWTIVVSKSLATGAYGTMYAVLVYPNSSVADGLMQRVYQFEGEVAASSPVPTHPDDKPERKWSDASHRRVKRLIVHYLSSPKSNHDDSNDAQKDCQGDGHNRFLDDAKAFFEQVTAIEWPVVEPGCPSQP